MPVSWCSTSVQFYCIVANNQSNQSQKRLRGFQISVWSWVKSTAAVQGAESRSSWRPALLPSSQPSPSTPQGWWHSPSRILPLLHLIMFMLSSFQYFPIQRKGGNMLTWSPDHLITWCGGQRRFMTWFSLFIFDLVFGPSICRVQRKNIQKNRNSRRRRRRRKKSLRRWIVDDVMICGARVFPVFWSDSLERDMIFLSLSPFDLFFLFLYVFLFLFLRLTVS